MKTTTLLLAFLLCAGLLSFGQSTSTVPVKKFIKTEIPESIRNSKQFKRAEWFTRQRAFPYDTILVNRYYREMDREMNKVKSGRLKSSDNPAWTAVGPRGVQTTKANWGTVSGRVRAIAVHPTDPLTVYIGAASGGQSRALITVGPGNQTHFSDLEVSPYNSNIILATQASGYEFLGIVLPNDSQEEVYC